MRVNEWLIRLCSLALAALGFLFSAWALIALGVILAAVYGRFVLAVALALFADLLFGMPQGFFHALVFPFTALALCIVAARALSIRHLREPDLY